MMDENTNISIDGNSLTESSPQSSKRSAEFMPNDWSDECTKRSRSEDDESTKDSTTGLLAAGIKSITTYDNDDANDITEEIVNKLNNKINEKDKQQKSCDDASHDTSKSDLKNFLNEQNQISKQEDLIINEKQKKDIKMSLSAAPAVAASTTEPLNDDNDNEILNANTTVVSQKTTGDNEIENKLVYDVKCLDHKKSSQRDENRATEYIDRGSTSDNANNEDDDTKVMQRTQIAQQSEPQQNNYNSYSSQNAASHAAAPCTRMKIPEYGVGFVIGRGGDTVRRIQNETGASIVIESKLPSDENLNKDCLITGSLDSVKRAEAAIQELIEIAKTSHARRSGSGNYSYHTQFRLVIPADKNGILIGNNGETIRSLRLQSGCRIEIDQNDCGPNQKVYILTGSSERIKIAHDLIVARLSMPRSHPPNSSVPHSKSRHHHQHLQPHYYHQQHHQQHHQQQQQQQHHHHNRYQQQAIHGPYAAGVSTNSVYGVSGNIQPSSSYRSQMSQMANTGYAPAHHMTPHNPYSPYGVQPYWQQSMSSLMQQQDADWNAYCAQAYVQMQSYQMMGGSHPHHAAALHAQTLVHQPQVHVPQVSQSSSANVTETNQQQLGVQVGNVDPAEAVNTEYLTQWAQYYRATGMIKEAEMIEQQLNQHCLNADKTI